jgi:hypothetical protein
MIGWKDYLKPNLRLIRNAWVVEVSIPCQYGICLAMEVGQVRHKATGTTDKAIAEKRVTELAYKIYGKDDLILN